MNTSIKRELGNLVLDVLVSLVLFVTACAFAGAIQEYITPNIRWLYSVWFAIGMLPLCFYARYRGVFAFNRWDILAYSPFPFVIGVAHHWLEHPITLVATAIVMLTVGAYIRRLLPKGSGGLHGC